MHCKRSVLTRARIATALFLLGMAGLGCGAHSHRMQLSVTADANNNSPVVFSVILPRNQAVYRKLLDLTAKQWFSQREQLLRDYRTDLDESYYEFVPGQVVPELLQKGGRRNVSQGILFVNYQTSGAHRYTFDADKPMKVTFGQRSLNFAP